MGRTVCMSRGCDGKTAIIQTVKDMHDNHDKPTPPVTSPVTPSPAEGVLPNADKPIPDASKQISNAGKQIIVKQDAADIVQASSLAAVDAVTFAPEVVRVGVALGGGSARGYAHIGALISLERHGLTPSVIVGTSFGAIIGSMYASGHSLEDLRHFATSQRRRDLLPQLIDFGLHKAALFRGDKLEDYFERLLEGRHFADLDHNFAIVATDVDTGERVLLQEGSLARALRASASMPGIFAPVEIDGRRLMDGGIGAPVPLDTLEHFATDLAIGIEVGLQCEDSASIQFAQRCLSTAWGNRVHVGLRDTTGGHPVLVFGRTLAHTFTAWQTTPSLPTGALNIHTKPPINWLNFHRAEEAIIAGEQALEAYMPTIKNVLLARQALSGE